MFDEGRNAIATSVEAIGRLTPGQTGNLSVREGESIAITPSGVPYSDISASDIPVINPDGQRQYGSLEPSSEVPMHLGIYDAMDTSAIAHVHSPWATTLAVLREPVPPVHYMLAMAGETVPVASYATFGTEQLAENAVSAMNEADSSACLLANHGLVATGDSVFDAIETVRAVESTAQLYLQAKSVGDPVHLDESNIDTVQEAFESYGQQPDG